MSNLAFYRKQARMTQADLGQKVGVRPTTIGNQERGERTPRLGTARAVVRVLNSAGVQCTIDDVYPEQGPQS